MEQVSNGARNQLQEGKKQFFSPENSDGANLVKLPKALKAIKQHSGNLHSKAASLLDFSIEEVKFSTDGEKISFDELLKPVQKKTTKDKVKNDVDPLCDVSLNIIEPTVLFPLVPKQFESINLQLGLGDSSSLVEGKKNDVATDIDLPVIINADDSPKPKRSISLNVNEFLTMSNKALSEPGKAMKVAFSAEDVKLSDPAVLKSSISLSFKIAEQDSVQIQDLYDNNTGFVSFIDSAEEEISPQIIELPLDIGNKKQSFLEPVAVQEVENSNAPVKVLTNTVNKLMTKMDVTLKNESNINLIAKIEPKIVDQAPVLGSLIKKQTIISKPEQQQVIPLSNAKLQPVSVAPKILPAKKANVSQKINSQSVEQKQPALTAAKQLKVVIPKSSLVNKVDFKVRPVQPMQPSLKSIGKELVKNFKVAAPLKNIESEDKQIDLKPLIPVTKQSASVAKKAVVDLPLAQPLIRRPKYLSFAEGRSLNFGVTVEKIDNVNVIDKPMANFSAFVGVEITNVRKQGDLQQIDLVLKPEHLGKLVAKLRFIDKQLLVEIQAPNKDTAKTLLLNENLLKDAIKNAGLSHKHELKLIISDKSGVVNILHAKRNEVVSTAVSINHNEGLESFLGGNSDAPNSERKKFKKKAKDMEIDLSTAPKRDFGGNSIEKVLSNNSDNLLII